MQCKVTINEQGEITIPSRIRKALGLNGSDVLIVEITDSGMLLRPALSMPIEIYSEKRIREFNCDEGQIGKMICDKRGKSE